MKKINLSISKEILNQKEYIKVYSSINNAKNITEIRNNLRKKKFTFSNKKITKMLELSKTTIITFYINNRLYVAKCENHKKLHYTDKTKFKIRKLEVFNYQ